LKKWFLECESLSERSGDPALRGFRDFSEIEIFLYRNSLNFGKKPHQQAGALQNGFFSTPFSLRKF
jgi:hypothetical protein